MENEDTLFRELCENAHDMIQCVAPDGTYLYVNGAWLRTLGYEKHEVPGLTFGDIVHPDSEEHCNEIFAQLLEGRDAVQITADFRAKDGHRICVEGSASCRREEGAVISTQGIFHDVTERRQTQQELDRLFALSQDLLCVAGTDGYFKQINPAFVHVLGYSREELLSRSFLEFVHPDDREGTLREVENLARGKMVIDFRNRYRARDGGYRWLAWRATPFPERGLMYSIARDITEEKRTQELLERQASELARSNADLERFAYVASHDLRSPLRTIRDLADWIANDLPESTPEAARKNLERLEKRAARLEALIDDVLRYARAGRGKFDVHEVDTAKVVAELAELVAPHGECTIVANPGLPTFVTDRAALELVLRNLLDNAVKHHDANGGHIEVSAFHHGEWFEFAVVDDGPGIRPEDREQVFEMFQTTGSAGQGTGMGLALVKRLVESHGGRVRLDPTEERGLTVRFTWPRTIHTGTEMAGTGVAERGKGADADDSDR